MLLHMHRTSDEKHERLTSFLAKLCWHLNSPPPTYCATRKQSMTPYSSSHQGQAGENKKKATTKDLVDKAKYDVPYTTIRTSCVSQLQSISIKPYHAIPYIRLDTLTSIPEDIAV
ncbi:unnamed protein product [Didymodactylos carnosus]|uniref:Uncharacterized protein n=1 Tax=Didymodactylos carnosus TaxID=1234261 RepID=A0A815BJ04_9BILA|nr:unnamed protein product [Didymodactylos carnosus]CAF4058882.1 unnamed protein product [Didymodactylos carnosus]